MINAIAPGKDVDGFHISNVGRWVMVPCTPLGCLRMLRGIHGSLSGMNAVVLGRSTIVGKPMAQFLLAEDCTVTIAHSRSSDLAEICRRADILVVAVGRVRMVPGHWIRPGATVIDVGINRVTEDGQSRLVGDVDFTGASQIAGAITPVPDGVGLMTIVCLLFNTLHAFCDANHLPRPAGL